MDKQLKFPELLQTQPYLNGQWVDTAQHFAVHNPATGQEIAQVGAADLAQAEACLQAAKAAQKLWQAQSAPERSRLLRTWLTLILAHQDDLARIMTLEQGKPLAEARGEIAYAASFVEWFAEEAKRVYGETIPAPSTDRRLLVIKQPVGLAAAVTPWNFPSSMITRKAAPALAAGCSFVVRPASATPLSALALAKLAEMAGFPPGLFNVITSKQSQAMGELLAQSPLVDKFSFTGSTEVGRQLMALCASTVKRLSLELGGNAPFIVFDDADLDAAVAGALASKYRNAGQTCVCANRFLVQRGISAAFTARLAEAVRRLKVGSGLEPGVDIGPLINAAAVRRVDQLVQAAIQDGAQLVCGGKALSGNFYQPTVITNVHNRMALAQEEIFGPVAPILVFDRDEEAIELANDTPYGLASYFYAQDIRRVWRVAEGLAYGMVGINEGLISNAVAPFGGIKQSGLGREGSRHGMDEYLEIKYLCLGNM